VGRAAGGGEGGGAEGDARGGGGSAMGQRVDDVAQLLTAAAAGEVEQVKRLLSSGLLGAESADYDGRRAMHVAAAEGQTHIVHALLAHGASTTCEDRWGNTPVKEAQAHGHEQLAMFLRSVGANAGGLLQKEAPV
jgi:glutaminase